MLCTFVQIKPIVLPLPAECHTVTISCFSLTYIMIFSEKSQDRKFLKKISIQNCFIIKKYFFFLTKINFFDVPGGKSPMRKSIQLQTLEILKIYYGKIFIPVTIHALRRNSSQFGEFPKSQHAAAVLVFALTIRYRLNDSN